MQNRPLSLAVPKRTKRTKSCTVNLLIPIQLGIVMPFTAHKITTGYDFLRVVRIMDYPISHNNR